ncbi:TetR/AcrR family transcriptional regulator [Mycolicibacterium xanthum]|uniref:TetR/AcrR family transcriptional regulator n=1 Tax=Mycolicibacterium xanthum TaxID=2796469 RepID=UPI002103EC6D|nr:TetR/AcrR family transcriptional regulator [Mycolicibacterium xanthum]
MRPAEAGQAQPGRANQRSRTRKDLLEAASRLMKQGRRITVEDVAGEALVSRATAYRYFPNLESLLLEAPIEGAVPSADELFRGVSADDPVERLERVDAALSAAISENEPALRLMLAHAIQHAGDLRRDIPARQNRRTALIEAALAPARDQFSPAALRSLTTALALVIGTESVIVFKDVLQKDDSEARRVRRWMIRTLVEAARRPPG